MANKSKSVDKKKLSKALTEQEKNYCIQRAKGEDRLTAYRLCYACEGVHDSAIHLRTHRLEIKESIINEIKLLKKPLAQAQAAKQIVLSEIWTPIEKNTELKRIAQLVAANILNDEGRPDSKMVDSFCKLATLSAQLGGELQHNVKVSSESISYVFNLDVHDKPINIIEHG